MSKRFLNKNIKLGKVVFLTSCFLSLIILPSFNTRNFFFIFDWNLYSFGPNENIYEIRWSNQNNFTYLFKEKNNLLKNDYKFPQIQMRILFNLIQRKKFDHVFSQYKAALKEICLCTNIEILKIETSWKKYLLSKDYSEINIEVLKEYNL